MTGAEIELKSPFEDLEMANLREESLDGSRSVSPILSAPRAGIEPAKSTLTAWRCTTQLPRNVLIFNKLDLADPRGRKRHVAESTSEHFDNFPLV